MVNELVSTKGKGGVPDARTRKAKIAEVVSQMQDIQELMRQAMKEGLHFGVQPGTTKKVLFLPGAEKLRMLFRLDVKDYVIEKEWDGDHLTVTVRTYFTRFGEEEIAGVGIGMCTTMESKYRYRTAQGEDTGAMPPKAYWDLRNKAKTATEKERQEMFKQAQALIGGPGHSVKKNDAGHWSIFKSGEAKVENPNLADTYNTVIKMAKKRSYVDGIRMITAASDIFDVDLKEEAEPPLEPEVVGENGTKA